MSEKVILPNEVAEAIEHLRGKGYSDSEIVSRSASGGFGWYEIALVNFGADKLMRALVIGYEVEKTPEDKVRELYEDRRDSSEGSFYSAQADVIQETLNILGIKIEGVNAE